MPETTTKLLFILGVPRSGTTLLRELLTQHSDITMPKDEFQLLPYFLKKYKTGQELSQADLGDIHTVLGRSPFYYHLKTDKDLANLHLPDQDIESALMEIFKYFSPEKTGYQAQWVGEKTPNNLLHIFDIESRFAGAKFIHVVRDPRDVALSMKQAWGKSLPRAIAAWEKSINLALSFEKEFPDKILHIKYEDLIENAEGELRRTSTFLAIDFESRTTTLLRAREKMGNAAGVAKIMTNNSGKYVNKMKPSDIQKVDGYLSDHLHRFSYPKSASTETISMNPARLKLMGLVDFIRSFSWHIRDKGFIQGTAYRLKQVLFR